MNLCNYLHYLLLLKLFEDDSPLFSLMQYIRAEKHIHLNREESPCTNYGATPPQSNVELGPPQYKD